MSVVFPAMPDGQGKKRGFRAVAPAFMLTRHRKKLIFGLSIYSFPMKYNTIS
jgi:hypothetical protein